MRFMDPKDFIEISRNEPFVVPLDYNFKKSFIDLMKFIHDKISFPEISLPSIIYILDVLKAKKNIIRRIYRNISDFWGCALVLANRSTFKDLDNENLCEIIKITLIDENFENNKLKIKVAIELFSFVLNCGKTLFSFFNNPTFNFFSDINLIKYILQKLGSFFEKFPIHSSNMPNNGFYYTSPNQWIFESLCQDVSLLKNIFSFMTLNRSSLEIFVKEINFNVLFTVAIEEPINREFLDFTLLSSIWAAQFEFSIKLQFCFRANINSRFQFVKELSRSTGYKIVSCTCLETLFETSRKFWDAADYLKRIKYMIENGAFINVGIYSSPLFEAICTSSLPNVKLIEYLLKKGASLERLERFDIFKPTYILSYVCGNINDTENELYSEKAFKILQLMIKKIKKDKITFLIYSLNFNENTPLHVCVSNNSFQATKLLLREGISLKYRGPDGKTMLSYAITQKMKDLLHKFMQKKDKLMLIK